MYIQQFAYRNTNVGPAPFMLWDGVSISDLRDYNEVFRPGTNWTIVADGNGQVLFYKDGSADTSLTPGYWLKLEGWSNSSSPPMYTDYALQSAWERVGGSEPNR
jgi:hypothetical protein